MVSCRLATTIALALVLVSAASAKSVHEPERLNADVDKHAANDDLQRLLEKRIRIWIRERSTTRRLRQRFTTPRYHLIATKNSEYSNAWRVAKGVKLAILVSVAIVKVLICCCCVRKCRACARKKKTTHTVVYTANPDQETPQQHPQEYPPPIHQQWPPGAPHTSPPQDYRGPGAQQHPQQYPPPIHQQWPPGAPPTSPPQDYSGPGAQQHPQQYPPPIHQQWPSGAPLASPPQDYRGSGAPYSQPQTHGAQPPAYTAGPAYVPPTKY